MFVLCRCFFTIFFLSCISTATVSEPQRSSEQRDVMVLTAGWSPLLQEYFGAVMASAAMHSQGHSGEYRLLSPGKSAAPLRVRQMVNEGGYIFIDFSSNDANKPVTPDPITANQRKSYQLPLLKGILGLRKLIVNSDQLEKFALINNLQTFLALTAGQQAEWPDIAMYANAGIKIKGSMSYAGLFPMLTMKRFDYLPLGIIEIQEALKQSKFSASLGIPENTYVFYHAPIYVNVMQKYEHESQKIISGLETIIQNGVLDRIFSSYFGAYIERIDVHSAKVFMLENPAFDRLENQKIFAKTRQLYFDNQAQFFEVYSN